MKKHTWARRRAPAMAATTRGFAAPSRVLLALAAMLCVVTAESRGLDARLGERQHSRGPRDGVFYKGPSYDGCCDLVNGAVLDCCRTGGCCPGAVEGGDGTHGFLDCCETTTGDALGNSAVSRVVFHGPAVDGCCDVMAGEQTMDCCTRGGGCCSPDDAGVTLDCCVAVGGDHAEARLGQALAEARPGGVLDSELGKKGRESRDGESAGGSDFDARETQTVGHRGESVVHPVSPEVAFLPAEEFDVNDPTYGRFARLNPGGEGYYEKGMDSDDGDANGMDDDANASAADAAQNSKQDWRAVAAAANDDSVDPVDPGLQSTRGTPGLANSEVREEEGKEKRLHTRRWWEKYASRRGGSFSKAGNTSWQTFALQGAATVCVVVWLTTLVVSAVLKKADGRGEEEERRGLL